MLCCVFIVMLQKDNFDGKIKDGNEGVRLKVKENQQGVFVVVLVKSYKILNCSSGYGNGEERMF